MLQNAYFLAKIGADTAENQRHSAKNLPKICKFLFSKETVDWDRAFADELKKRKELGTVDTKPVPPPKKGSVFQERTADFTGLVLGCIEANFCK